MRRIHASISQFNRTWDEYKRGFNDKGDFWIGNDRLHSMSTSRTCANELLIRLKISKENSTILAHYDHIFVDDQFNSYRLTLGMLEQNPLLPPGSPFLYLKRNIMCFFFCIFQSWMECFLLGIISLLRGTAAQLDALNMEVAGGLHQITVQILH